MPARYLSPGDERLAWVFLIEEPGFSLPALNLLERQGLDGPARFVVEEDRSGRPLLGAVGVGGRWVLFGTPHGTSPAPAVSLARLLARAGASLVEGEAHRVLAVLRHAALGPPQSLERYVMAGAPVPASPAAPIPPAGAGTGWPGDAPRDDHRAAARAWEVRPAHTTELPAVERLYLDHGEPVQREALREAMLMGHLWVAVGSARPLAAAMAPLRTQLAAWIGAVFTHPEHRCRGLASALVASLTRTLHSQGLTPYLLYRPGGPGRLYRRLGFTPVGSWLRVSLCGPGAG